MPTPHQHVAVSEELLTAVRLVKCGLRELNRLDGSSDFFHLPMLLLASGFERMLKTVICCHHLQLTGEYPTQAEFKELTRKHDLEFLCRRITEDCFSEHYLSQVPAARDDIELLRSDPDLLRIVCILSEFGQRARYHNLDIVVGKQNDTSSPEAKWREMKLDLLRRTPDWQSSVSELKESRTAQRGINKQLTVQCERFARSLSRLFTIGDLGDQARRISGHTTHFRDMRDSQLGGTNYESIDI